MEMVGVKERPGAEELVGGLHMLYLFRWRAVLGVLIACAQPRPLGIFGPAPEIWWLTFGYSCWGWDRRRCSKQETRTDNPAAKSYYRWSRIGSPSCSRSSW